MAGSVVRPCAVDALCRAAACREFDVVMAWPVDRLGRSLQDLVARRGGRLGARATIRRAVMGRIRGPG
jgi:hypothetical protein